MEKMMQDEGDSDRKIVPRIGLGISHPLPRTKHLSKKRISTENFIDNNNELCCSKSFTRLFYIESKERL